MRKEFSRVPFPPKNFGHISVFLSSMYAQMDMDEYQMSLKVAVLALNILVSKVFLSSLSLQTKEKKGLTVLVTRTLKLPIAKAVTMGSHQIWENTGRSYISAGFNRC